jgi:hypothetical protein
MGVVRSGVLAGFAVATIMMSLPSEAEAKGGRGLGAAISVGRSIDRGYRAGQDKNKRDDGLPSPEVAGDDKAGAADAPADAAGKDEKAAAAAKLDAKVVATTTPLVANALVCIAIVPQAVV